MAADLPADEHNQVLQYQTQYEDEKVTFYLGAAMSSQTEDIKSRPPDVRSDEGLIAQRSDSYLSGELLSSELTSTTSNDSDPSQTTTSSTSDAAVVKKYDKANLKDSKAQVVTEDEEEIRFIDEDGDSQLDDDIAVLLPGDTDGKTHDEELEQTEKLVEHLSQQGEAQSHTQSKEEIMTKFEVTEKIFREKFLSPRLMDLSMKRETEMSFRSPDLSLISASSCAERLDHLIKVLEQLTFLRHQNGQLRKKCSFLEDTRYLLQVQNDMLMARDHGRSRTLFKQNQRMMNFFDSATSKIGFDLHHMSPLKRGHERQHSESSDIIMHSTPQDKGGSIIRSQSDGSLDLVDMEFSVEHETELNHTTSSSMEKTTSPITREYFMSRADFHKKSRKLQQKWERVKKVFSGKPEHGHTTKQDAVSAEQLVKANTKRLEKYRPPDLENIPCTLLSASTEDNPPTPNSIHSEPPEIHGHVDEEYDHKFPESRIPICKLKRSHSADSITSNSSNANQHFLFDDRSLSNQSQSSLDRTQYLRLEGRLERRRSSPTLSLHSNDKDFMTIPGASRMIRSSSVKLIKSSTDLDLDGQSNKKIVSSDAAKKAKAAWVRVKDIIHTRKDSLKKGKPRRPISHTMSDGEISPNGRSSGAKFHIGDVDIDTRRSRDRTRKLRSTGTGKYSSPLRPRPRTVGPESTSPGRILKRQSLAHVMPNTSPIDVAASMGITDDFNKRMQEWEEKKKRGLVKANSFSYDMDAQKSLDKATKFSEDFIKKMEEWEQMKGLSSPPKSPDPELIRAEPVIPSTEPSGKVALQNLSESFSKTVQEWERVKERRAREGTSPGPETRGREHTVERSKSRERDRSRHKFEKEIQKIERKEWKIEREKQKLERMKMKLDMAMESSSGSEGFGDGIMLENIKKHLHEKESRMVSIQSETKVMASKQHKSESVVMSEEGIAIHNRSMSTKDFSSESTTKLLNRERIFSDSCIQPLAITQRSMSYEPYSCMGESPPEQGAMAMLAAPPRDLRGKSSETDDSGTLQHTASSEESTGTLLRQLEDKDEQLKDLQYDVQQLTDRINLMDREQNQKIEGYKRQLKAANRMSQFSCQTYQMDKALRELHSQVDMLIQAQDILVKEKHSLENKLQANIEDHKSSKSELLSQIQSLQEQVDVACSSKSDNPRPTVTALCGLINQAQDKLSRLQQNLSNRTSTIHDLERLLLTQKVNNKLLEAGLQRQAIEIGYLREQKRKHVIKRSKTFSGHDLCIRQDGRLDIRSDNKSLDDSKLYYSLSKKPPSSNTTGNLDNSSFDLPADWVQVIQKQLDEVCKRRSPSPKPADAKETVCAHSQTITTLLNCPHIVIKDGAEKPIPTPIMQSEQTQTTEDDRWADTSGKTPINVPFEVKVVATQTSVEDDETRIVAIVTDVVVPTVTATCEMVPKPGILKSSPHSGINTPGGATKAAGSSQTAALKGSPKAVVSSRESSIPTKVTSPVSDIRMSPQSAVDSLESVKSPKAGATGGKKSDVIPKGGATGSKKSDVIPKGGATGSTKSDVIPKGGATGSTKSAVIPKGGATGSTKSDVIPKGGTTGSTKSDVIPKGGTTGSTKSDVTQKDGATGSTKLSTSPKGGATRSVRSPESVKRSDISPRGGATRKGMSQTKRETAIRGRPSGSSLSDDTSDIKRHSYQEWLKREPKPFKLDMRKTTSLDVPDMEDTQTAQHSLETDEVFTSKEESVNPREKKSAEKNLLSPEDSASPQLPHSPVIRSKNVRKLKNSDNRATAITGDARTWKATPPRRLIRHRKNIVERLSIGAVLSEDENLLEQEAAEARLRTKSDSSELTRACQIARENSMKRKKNELSGSGEHISVSKNLLEVHSYVSRHTARSSSGVRDMIGRFEDGNFERGNVFRKSPSPSVPKFAVMCPKRLKTAAELLQDSIDHRSRSRSLTDKAGAVTREKLTSTSSDKENSSSSRGRYESGIRQQLSLDSPLAGESPKVSSRGMGYSMQSDVDTQDLAKPLKDLTNDKADGNGSHSAPALDQPHLGSAEVGRVQKPSPLATFLSKQNPPKSQLTPEMSSARSETSSEPKSPRHMSKGDSIDSQSSWSYRSSEHDDSCTESGSPWHLAKEPAKPKVASDSEGTKSERKARSKSKARFWSKDKFFDKRAKSQSPSRAGAISALCMQTMTLSVDDDSQDSQTAQAAVPSNVQPVIPQSPESEKRSRRQKFLESSWFQKPKGIFRISKC